MHVMDQDSHNLSRLGNPGAVVNPNEQQVVYYFAYNFIKIHRTLRTSPAMAAGVTDRLWDVADLVALWGTEERKYQRAA